MDNMLNTRRPVIYRDREYANAIASYLNETRMQNTVMTFTDKKGNSYKKNILTGKRV